MNLKLIQSLLTIVLITSVLFGFSQELISFQDENNKWGAIDSKGDTVIFCKYDYVHLINYNFNHGADSSCYNDCYNKFNNKYAMAWLNNKCGLFNVKGERLIDYIYTSMSSKISCKGLLQVWNNDSLGFIDTLGNIIIPAKYTYIETNGECRYDDIIIENGEEFLRPSSISNPYFINGYCRVSKNGQSGFIDKTGKEVVPCKYIFDSLYVKQTDSSFIKIFLGDVDEDGYPSHGKYGFINKKTMKIIPCKYSLIRNFVNNDIRSFSWVFIGETQGASDWKEPIKGKYGIINALKEETVPCKYDYMELILNYVFSKSKEPDMFIRVKLNGKYGVIDTLGNELIPCKYNNIYFHELGRYHSSSNYIYNTDNKIIIAETDTNYQIYNYTDWEKQKTYSSISLKVETSFIKVFNGEIEDGYHYNYNIRQPKGYSYDYKGKFGYIDLNGKEILPCKYSNIKTNGGFIITSILDTIAGDELNCLFDSTGKEILSPCEYYISFYDYFIFVEKVKSYDDGEDKYWEADSEFYYFNSKAHQKLIKFKDVDRFNNGLALVKTKKKWGYIDKEGNEVIPFKYTDANSFEDGKAKVTYKGKEFYINTKGERIE